MLCNWYLLLWIALFNFFDSNASLTDFSFFTVITTGLTNRSSGHFYILMTCLSWINLSNSSIIFSRRWSDTLPPFCWFGIWFCLNIDLAIWFIVFPSRVHTWGHFSLFKYPFYYIFLCFYGWDRINWVTWWLFAALLQGDPQFLQDVSTHQIVCLVYYHQLWHFCAVHNPDCSIRFNVPSILMLMLLKNLYCVWLVYCWSFFFGLFLCSLWLLLQFPML